MTSHRTIASRLVTLHSGSMIIRAGRVAAAESDPAARRRASGMTRVPESEFRVSHCQGMGPRRRGGAGPGRSGSVTVEGPRPQLESLSPS